MRSRLMLVAAALLLVGTFFVPLWRIQLHAPQYPEGLGMLIRLDTITGIKPADLDNINGLNHYIGMKVIEPEHIPVLQVMPLVVGGLIAIAALVAFTGLRLLLLGWLATFAIAGGAGMFEFYRWSYDYGHNLAADAIIKVPGMSYQPPLIGSKTLLNFVAESWPASGSWLAAAAFILGVIAFWPRRRNAVTAVLLATAAACASPDPRPLEYGHRDCDVCRMRITDQRFGGEFVSQTGKVQQFDSIECLVNYVGAATSAPRSLWVIDFAHPGTLIPVHSARFQRRAGPSAGMGANLVALSDTTISGMTWDELRVHVAGSTLREKRGDA